jgi:hypothetical protein
MRKRPQKVSIGRPRNASIRRNLVGPGAVLDGSRSLRLKGAELMNVSKRRWLTMRSSSPASALKALRFCGSYCQQSYVPRSFSSLCPKQRSPVSGSMPARDIKLRPVRRRS